MRHIAYILGHLNMWSIVSGPVWIVLRGVAFSGRSMSLGTGFESLKSCSISIQLSLFSVCSPDVTFQLFLLLWLGLPAVFSCCDDDGQSSSYGLPQIRLSFCKLTIVFYHSSRKIIKTDTY